MYGFAEKYPSSISRQIVDSFEIGQTYSSSDIEKVLGYKPGGADRKGVLGSSDCGYLLLKITFQKQESMNDNYDDRIVGTTLFWSSQNNRRYAERYACDGRHDVFIFVRVTFGSEFLYYGRAVPTRVFHSKVDGVPSKVVFELEEYAKSEFYKSMNEIETNYDMLSYRNNAFDLWDNKSSIGNIHNQEVLVVRHIKPVSESRQSEIIDASNSLILTPTMDSLFSRGIISFSEEGDIKLPSSVPMRVFLESMDVDERIKIEKMPEGTRRYLKYHSSQIFGYDNCRLDWLVG